MATDTVLSDLSFEGARSASRVSLDKLWTSISAANSKYHQHLREGSSSAESMYAKLSSEAVERGVPAQAVPVLVIIAALLVVLLLRSCLFSRTASKQRPAARAMLPAFDVEGGASAGNGNTRVLHPSISAAAAHSDVATLRQWLASDRCVIDAALAVDGSTALHHGARAGHANIVRLLLDHGADCLTVDAELKTPLHHVANEGHGLCVKALLDAGADPEAKDGQGQSALALAEAGKHMGTARMMRLHIERRKAEGHANLRRNV